MIYPYIDPIAFSIGPLKVHWYGLMYLAGFAGAWWLGTVRARAPASAWSAEQVGDLIFYGAIGVVVGGRVGYMLFYNPFLPPGTGSAFWEVWKGGMSFHGGLLGVLIAAWLFGRKHAKTFFQVTDFVAPLVPIGLGAGRIGNFINGELWGKVTDLPWGMQLSCLRFPQYCDAQASGGFSLPRHPNQLYEFALEGVALFLILWLYSRRPRPVMAVSGLFLLCYGMFRFVIEFVRLPDAPIGYLAFGWVTMGQVLSLPMILLGVLLVWQANKNKTGIA